MAVVGEESPTPTVEDDVSDGDEVARSVSSADLSASRAVEEEVRQDFIRWQQRLMSRVENRRETKRF